MYRLTQGLATIFCLSLLQGCGGGGGGKGPESPQPPPSNTRPPLRLSAADYQLALKASIGTTMNAFNYVLGGDLADLMLDLPVPRDVVLLPCPDGGTTLLTIGDRNSDGFFNTRTPTYQEFRLAVLVAVDSTGGGTADAAVTEFPWSDVMPRELFDAFRTPVVVATPVVP